MKNGPRKRTSSHRSLFISSPTSCSHYVVAVNNDQFQRKRILSYLHAMIPFDVAGGNEKASVEGLTEGNWKLVSQTKLQTCRYLPQPLVSQLVYFTDSWILFIPNEP